MDIASTEFKKIVLGCDHAGFKLKQHLILQLQENKTFSNAFEIEDLGTFNEDSVDYPDYAALVAERMDSGNSSKNNTMGLLICGTGIGMSIKANRYKHIRAALCYSTEYAQLARQHNNANVLVLGGRFTSNSLALQIFTAFISTPFASGRHKQRVEKL